MTTATAGKIGIESTDNVTSGGLELNLGLKGVGAQIAMVPLGDIDIRSTLGTTGITMAAALGDVSLNTMLTSIDMTKSGAVEIMGVAGDITINQMGKITIAAGAATLKEVLEEMLDIIKDHTHPTGTGPSGIPMAPAAAKIPMLKTKIGMAFG